MRRPPEVRGSVVGLLAYLGKLTWLAWLFIALFLVGGLLATIWAGPPYGLAVALGGGQLAILFWGDRHALRAGLKRRPPEGPPSAW